MEGLICDADAHSGFKANGWLGAGSQEAADNKFIQPLLVWRPVILS